MLEFHEIKSCKFMSVIFLTKMKSFINIIQKHNFKIIHLFFLFSSFFQLIPQRKLHLIQQNFFFFQMALHLHLHHHSQIFYLFFFSFFQLILQQLHLLHHLLFQLNQLQSPMAIKYHLLYTIPRYYYLILICNKSTSLMGFKLQVFHVYLIYQI